MKRRKTETQILGMRETAEEARWETEIEKKLRGWEERTNPQEAYSWSLKVSYSSSSATLCIWGRHLKMSKTQAGKMQKYAAVKHSHNRPLFKKAQLPCSSSPFHRLSLKTGVHFMTWKERKSWNVVQVSKIYEHFLHLVLSQRSLRLLLLLLLLSCFSCVQLCATP